MRQSEPAPARDENRDGRTDGRDEHADGRNERSTGTATVADSARTDTRTDTGPASRTEERDDATRTDDTAKHRAGTTLAEPDTAPQKAPPVAPTPPVATKTETRRETGRTDEPERGLGERTPETEPVVVDRGPRPRASMLATLSLILGVAAAAFVLAGALAGYGIVLGTLALLLGVGGVSATARRHVAGRTEALIGIVLGVGAVVVAVLAMTGQFDWPNTDGDNVVRLREWLDSQFVDRF
ncbi:thrombospondin [Plantactinospora sp. CA-294935]|uniref:thrombospondin n=1 Tax=Plantactinospora sp. CA-294935 TaxID=3240012 RepID=UPI003D92CE63